MERKLVWVFRFPFPGRDWKGKIASMLFSEKNMHTRGTCFQVKSSRGFSNPARTFKVGAANKNRKRWTVSDLKPLSE